MDGKSIKYEKMLKLASCVLRKTGEQIAELRKDNEKLSSEIINLKRSMEDANRFDETMKLAEKMHDKGLIKQAEIENALKVVELSLSSEEKVASDGVSNLSDFYLGELDDNDPMSAVLKANMADSIRQMADEF